MNKLNVIIKNLRADYSKLELEIVDLRKQKTTVKTVEVK
jgi:hypothetical protein